MIKRFPLGQPVVLDLELTTALGVLTDPTTLTLTIEKPDGTEVGPSGDYTWTGSNTPVITRTSTGVFVGTFTPAAVGVYSYHWLATGAAAGAFDGQFEMTSLVADVLSILKVASDYEAVRQVLGVTAIDVSDQVIESLPFGVDAEIRVKERWTTWAADLADAEKGPRIRLATVYLTASKIAAMYAQGGMVGFLQPKLGSPRDWSAVASQLNGMYEEALSDLSADTTVPVEYDLAGQKIDGPSRHETTLDWLQAIPVVVGDVP